MNHRKHGEVMYDETTGSLVEGIGHYGFEPLPGQKAIRSLCKNPYPCDFDRGILTAMARRFERSAVVRHDATQPCRQHGGESCTYHVRW